MLAAVVSSRVVVRSSHGYGCVPNCGGKEGGREGERERERVRGRERFLQLFQGTKKEILKVCTKPSN